MRVNTTGTQHPTLFGTGNQHVYGYRQTIHGLLGCGGRGINHSLTAKFQLVVKKHGSNICLFFSAIQRVSFCCLSAETCIKYVNVCSR